MSRDVLCQLPGDYWNLMLPCHRALV